MGQELYTSVLDNFWDSDSNLDVLLASLHDFGYSSISSEEKRRVRIMFGLSGNGKGRLMEGVLNGSYVLLDEVNAWDIVESVRNRYYGTFRFTDKCRIPQYDILDTYNAVQDVVDKYSKFCAS